MKVLIFGSRSLTWKYLPVFRALASLALFKDPPPPGPWMLDGDDDGWRGEYLPKDVPSNLLNGDGPPGKERGAIGADKLALLACMEAWPEARRRIRWFPPEPKPGETWAMAAARRDIEMAEARPDRAYCVHTDLDASKGSIITARALTERGIPYVYVRVTQAGALVSVETR